MKHLRIYLTNTLEEPVEKELYAFAEFISDEANAAVSVKRDEPLLVIIGNPPYPQDSANPNRDNNGEFTFIGGLIEDYKWVDGEFISGMGPNEVTASRLREVYSGGHSGELVKTARGLSVILSITVSLMVQFLEACGNTCVTVSTLSTCSICTVVTEEPKLPQQLREMRTCLTSCKVSPSCCASSNAIILPPLRFITRICGGAREEKYRKLLETDCQTTAWRQLQPTSPLYLFVPQTTERITEYEQGWGINDIFQTSSIGIITARDKLTIHWAPEKIRDTVADFASLPEAEAREKYELGQDSQDWQGPSGPSGSSEPSRCRKAYSTYSLPSL